MSVPPPPPPPLQPKKLEGRPPRSDRVRARGERGVTEVERVAARRVGALAVGALARGAVGRLAGGAPEGAWWAAAAAGGVARRPTVACVDHRDLGVVGPAVM